MTHHVRPYPALFVPPLTEPGAASGVHHKSLAWLAGRTAKLASLDVAEGYQMANEEVSHGANNTAST